MPGLLRAVAAAVVALGVASCGGSSTPAGPSGSTTPASTAPTSTAPTTPPASSTSAPFGYVPLWPFDSVAAAQSWQRSGATDAWHLDARATALRFTRDYLRITDVDRVTSRVGSDRDAHVGVGYPTEGGRTGTAAVVHVVRIGAGAQAPWEVVGTDDTSLTLTRPAYGALVTSPTVVGGRVSGVDENLRVTVRTSPSGGVAGSACCVPAGGERTPWSIRVPFSAAAGTTLTIVVTTGGHLLAVERFAVTGVRVR